MTNGWKMLDQKTGLSEMPCLGCQEPQLLAPGDHCGIEIGGGGEVLGIYCHACKKARDEASRREKNRRNKDDQKDKRKRRGK